MALLTKAVIKTRGPGLSPGYYEHGLQLLSYENKRKIEPKFPAYWLYLPCNLKS